MHKFQTNLEDAVRNAFIRRKANFIARAMQSDEYKESAKKTKQELIGLIASTLQYRKNSYAARGISLALEKIEDTLAGDIELHAINWAYDIYSDPKQLKQYATTMELLLESMGVETEKLKRTFRKYLDSVNGNETLISYVIELAEKQGSSVINKIDSAIKKLYPEKSLFIAKENEFRESFDNYMIAAQESALGVSEPDGIYASLVTEIFQKLISSVYQKAAEIEADELYGKSI